MRIKYKFINKNKKYNYNIFKIPAIFIAIFLYYGYQINLRLVKIVDN